MKQSRRRQSKAVGGRRTTNKAKEKIKGSQSHSTAQASIGKRARTRSDKLSGIGNRGWSPAASLSPSVFTPQSHGPAGFGLTMGMESKHGEEEMSSLRKSFSVTLMERSAKAQERRRPARGRPATSPSSSRKRKDVLESINVKGRSASPSHSPGMGKLRGSSSPMGPETEGKKKVRSTSDEKSRKTDSRLAEEMDESMGEHKIGMYASASAPAIALVRGPGGIEAAEEKGADVEQNEGKRDHVSGQGGVEAGAGADEIAGTAEVRDLSATPTATSTSALSTAPVASPTAPAAANSKATTKATTIAADAIEPTKRKEKSMLSEVTRPLHERTDSDLNRSIGSHLNQESKLAGLREIASPTVRIPKARPLSPLHALQTGGYVEGFLFPDLDCVSENVGDWESLPKARLT